MLIKLLKHEIKATGRIFLSIYALLVIFSVITKFVNRNMRVDSLFTGILVILPTILYACIIAGVCVMTLVLLIQRFSKNLLGAEGYLMHTLPVRPWQHIVCKLVVSSFWTICSVILVSFSALYMAVDVGGWRSFLETFRGILASAGATFRLSGNAFFWGFATILIVYIVEKTLMVYAGLAIGQLSSKQKVGASVGAIVGMNIVEQLLGVAVLAILGNWGKLVNMNGTNAEIIRFIFWWIICSAAAFGAIYAVISNLMLKRRLNLA